MDTDPSGASTPTDAESPYTSSSGMLFAPPTELEHLALGADTHWRERQSFHFYINITSPQVGGFFGSCFWGDLLIRASYYDSALRHVLIAIGALHEAILRRRHDYSKGVDVAPEFSLRHCNSAIALVSEVQSPQASGAAISLLTICLAITLFEAVQARSIEAMSHALQGVRLMDQFRDATTTATARTHCQPPHAIDPHVLAVVLSQVCYAIRGRSGTPVLDDSIESIELQDPSGIDSIQTACGLLELARNKIVTYCLSDLAKDSSFEAVCETSAKKHGYKVWLQIWEQAFTSFLSRESTAPSEHDIKRGMVLKANHLYALALVEGRQHECSDAYKGLDSLFRAIVNLSAEVLKTHRKPTIYGTTLAPFDKICSPYRLWVAQPLRLVRSGCLNAKVRENAVHLLRVYNL